ncbi:MAG: hypothetical protein OIN85_04390 [Candidatus Methanoperedens sp.]|nr:hypothetical protein [Candidatus Methanoperedens sp.]
MVEKKKVTRPKRENTAIPRPVMINQRSIQRAMNKVVGNLSDPDYQEQVTKLAQASANNSLETLQKLVQVSERMSKLDNKGWDTLIDGSVNDLMRAYLQFNSDLIVLLQKQSSKTIDILDAALPGKEEK